MSGIEVIRSDGIASIDLDLIRVLDRQIPLKSLDALIEGISPTGPAVPLGETAVSLDASVFLRITNHKNAADIIDYLTSKHAGPLILPGQVIQEFWNNQLQVVATIATSLRKKIDELRKELGKITEDFGDFAEQFEQLVNKFDEEHGQVYDEATVRKTRSMLEELKKKALVPYANRTPYCEIALNRKNTKTPPGFKDDGDGDFFVWVDLLTGLYRAKMEKILFSKVVFVTRDKKMDWSREGVPHPILSAEIFSLFEVPFEIWDIDRLSREVASAT